MFLKYKKDNYEEKLQVLFMNWTVKQLTWCPMRNHRNQPLVEHKSDARNHVCKKRKFSLAAKQIIAIELILIIVIRQTTEFIISLLIEHTLAMSIPSESK